MPDSKVISVERLPNAVWVHILPERLDESNLAAVRTETSSAGAESVQLPVFLDMAKVRFMASLSLGGLVQLSREFKVRGQRLVLAGLQPSVREMMAITRLDRLFEFHSGDTTELKGN